MAERPNVNPTPKQKFQAHAKVMSDHRDLMQNPALNYAIDMALAELARRMADGRIIEANMAAISHYRMVGAHEFVAILKNMAEMPELVKTTTETTTLDYTK